MSLLLSRLTKTATLRRVTSTTTDEFGDLVPVETTEDVAAHVRALSSSELGEDVAGERWKLYLPPWETLEASDRVTVDGELFEVVTIPVRRYSPRTRQVVSVECEIERRS